MASDRVIGSLFGGGPIYMYASARSSHVTGMYFVLGASRKYRASTSGSWRSWGDCARRHFIQPYHTCHLGGRGKLFGGRVILFRGGFEAGLSLRVIRGGISLRERRKGGFLDCANDHHFLPWKVVYREGGRWE